MKTTIQLLCLLMCISIVSSTYSLELDDTYISPTRLKQSAHDTPSSVTKLTSADIEALHVNSVDELFKYVAGMISSYASGNQPRISYHGTNGLVPRRMQVMINGISVVRPSYAEIQWDSLPINIHDIETIEITRSPSAATYGLNSMMAAINIKTKSPVSTPFVSSNNTVGSDQYSNHHLEQSAQLNDNAQYRFSLSKGNSTGFDKNFREEERRDGSDKLIMNGELTYAPNTSTTLRLFAAYSDVLSELEFRDAGQITFPDFDTKSNYLSASLDKAFSDKHSLKLNSYYTNVEQEIGWRSCYPAILLFPPVFELYASNKTYVTALLNNEYPTGGSAQDDLLRDQILAQIATQGEEAFRSTCGDIDEHGKEEKIDIELQDTLIINDNFRMVTGLGYSKNSFDSQTYLQGKVSTDTYRAFGNVEYRYNKLLFNVGSMYEKDIGGDSGFSPRLGINYRLTPSNSLRFVLSKAIRTPDISEREVNWYYFATNLDPLLSDGSSASNFYQSARGNPNLVSEEVLAREVSLYSSSTRPLSTGSITHQLDAKVFHNTLTNLVSDKLQVSNYNANNDGAVTLTGFELETKISIREALFRRLIDTIDVRLNYAYIDSDTSDFYEKSLHATHSGAAVLTTTFHNDLAFMLSYYGNSPINGENYDAIELGLSKKWNKAGHQWKLGGRLKYEPDLVNQFTVSENFNVQNVNNDHTSFYLNFNYSFR